MIMSSSAAARRDACSRRGSVENPDVKVLLLEAGGTDRHPFYHLPAGFAKMTKGIGSWGWHTVPQKHMNNMVIRYTQAKVIGGGSSINAQLYTRGNALDYDEWRQMGCEGWGYRDVLPYFRKAEDNDTFDNEYPRQRRAARRVAAGSASADLRGLVYRPRRRWASRATMISPARHRTASAITSSPSATPAARPLPWPILRRRGAAGILTVKTGAQVKRIIIEKGRAVGAEMLDGVEASGASAK